MDAAKAAFGHLRQVQECPLLGRLRTGSFCIRIIRSSRILGNWLHFPYIKRMQFRTNTQARVYRGCSNLSGHRFGNRLQSAAIALIQFLARAREAAKEALFLDILYGRRVRHKIIDLMT
jgi:hypothetical protein